MLREFIQWTPVLLLSAVVFLYVHQEPARRSKENDPLVVEVDGEEYADAEIDEAMEQEGFEVVAGGDGNDEDDDEVPAFEDEQEDADPVVREAIPAPRRRDRSKIVGKKKMRNLERRDQIRAYNEAVRQRGEEEREAIKLYEEQHAETIAEEKMHRALKEKQAGASIKARQAARREQEAEQRAYEAEATEKLRDILQKQGKAKLNNDLERRVAQELGLIVDDGNWVVRLDNADLLDPLAEEIANRGRVSFEDLSRRLS